MYDPQTNPPPLPPPGPPPPESRGGGLVWAAIGLGVFVALATLGIALLLLFTPNLRAQLPFIGPGMAAPPEAPRKETPAIGSGPIKIEDSFDQPSNRWDQSQARIVDGSYELRIDTANHDSYGLYLGPERTADTPPENQFDASQIANFDIAVDARHVAGDPSSEYGIRFRQSGPNDYLMFSISGSGYYRLLRVQNEEFKSEIPWTFDRRIKTGSDAVNRLRVVADGPTITGYVNDVQVLTFNDTVGTPGQLTLGLTTFDKGGLVVRFGNVVGQAEAGQAGDGSTAQRVDLKEDFSNAEQARWSVGGATISDGSYEIFTGPRVQSWQQPLPQGAWKVTGDFALEVDATLVNGSSEGIAYGIMFGDGGDFDFYSLYILPQGGITLFRLENGQTANIIPPVQYDQVKTGLNATNKIRVQVREGQLSISVNDGQLPDIPIPPDIKIEGQVGMIISGSATEGTQVRFDNFKLEELR